MPSILNSPRGHNAFKKLTLQDGSGNDVVITCNSTSLILDDGIRLSDGTNTLDLSVDANGLIVPGRVTLNSSKYISANSTGFMLEPVTAEGSIPSTRSSAKLIQLTDSTGTAFVINQTGTTWAYLNTTSERPS